MTRTGVDDDLAYGLLVSDDLAYGLLVGHVGQGLGQLSNLPPQRERGGQRGRDLLPLQEALDPPVFVVAAVQTGNGLAGPGQVVELAALGGFANLALDPALEPATLAMALNRNHPGKAM